MKMKRLLMVVSILVFTAATCITIQATGFPSDPSGAAAGGTCATKHCSPNTHCCYGCTANPICVRNGVPRPECAPQ